MSPTLKGKYLPWFIAAVVWFFAGLFVDAFIMGSGYVLPKAWILVWWGPPVFFTNKLIWMGLTVFLAFQGIKRI